MLNIGMGKKSSVISRAKDDLSKTNLAFGALLIIFNVSVDFKSQVFE